MEKVTQRFHRIRRDKLVFPKWAATIIA